MSIISISAVLLPCRDVYKQYTYSIPDSHSLPAYESNVTVKISFILDFRVVMLTTAHTDVLIVPAVVYTNPRVSTVEDIGLCSSTTQVIQPDPPSAYRQSKTHTYIRNITP